MNRGPLLSIYSVLQNLHLDRKGWSRWQAEIACGLVALVWALRALGISGKEAEVTRLVTHPSSSFLSSYRTLTSVDPFYRDTPHSNRYTATS